MAPTTGPTAGDNQIHTADEGLHYDTTELAKGGAVGAAISLSVVIAVVVGILLWKKYRPAPEPTVQQHPHDAFPESHVSDTVELARMDYIYDAFLGQEELNPPGLGQEQQPQSYTRF